MNSNSVEDLFLVTFIQNLIGNRVREWGEGRGSCFGWRRMLMVMNEVRYFRNE